MFAEWIVATIKATLAHNDAVIALSEPTFAGRERGYGKDCTGSGFERGSKRVQGLCLPSSPFLGDLRA